jgi:hypothetical protein
MYLLYSHTCIKVRGVSTVQSHLHYNQGRIYCTVTPALQSGAYLLYSQTCIKVRGVSTVQSHLHYSQGRIYCTVTPALKAIAEIAF